MNYLNKIINGDCLKILKQIPDNYFDTIYTDPIWPNNTVDEFKDVDPYELFSLAAQHFPRLAKRILIHLGCDSDPRILQGLPGEMPFLKVINLRYALPIYKGRNLYDRDIVYAFGEPPKPRSTRILMPGDFCCTENKGRYPGHPCPRRFTHVRWILDKFCDGPVLDPFAGSCTTAEAAVEIDLPYCCIEIIPEYVKIGNLRLKKQEERGIQISAI